MKKLFFILLIVICNLNSYAQDSTKKSTIVFRRPASKNFGVLLGANLANVGGDFAPADAKMRPAFHFGVFATAQPADILATGFEINYNMAGAKWQSGGNLNLHYLNGAFTVRLFPFDNKTWYLVAAPQAAYLFAANSTKNNTKENIISQYKTLDYGIGIGVGYNKTDYFIAIRNNWFFTESQKNTTLLNTRGYSNRIFQLSFGWYLK